MSAPKIVPKERQNSRIGPSLKADLSPAIVSSDTVLPRDRKDEDSSSNSNSNHSFLTTPKIYTTHHESSLLKVSELLHKTVDSPLNSPFSSTDSLASLVERQQQSKINHPHHQQQLFRRRSNNGSTHSGSLLLSNICGKRSSMSSHNQHTTHIRSPLSEKLNPFNSHFQKNNPQSVRKLEPAHTLQPHHIHSSPEVKEINKVHLEYDPISHRKVLNTYEIIKELGRGQHGKVKLAKDLVTNELVAIKIVDRTSRPRLGRPQDKTNEEKIRKEIAIMKKCNHPNIVQLKEVLDDVNSRKIYLVLEYLEKGELKWQTSKGVPILNLSQAIDIFRDVVLGLEYLHYQGIIHRDIKPANLLLSSNNMVKISDFGVSFATSLINHDQNEMDLCKTAGTPAFFAPELCSPLTNWNSSKLNLNDLSDQKIDYKVDIWALGITLYCLIFGDMPFWGQTEFELFDSIVSKPLTFPKEFPTNFNYTEEDKFQVKNLLCKLLEKDPQQRLTIKQIKSHPLVLRDLSTNKAKIFSYEQKSKDDKIQVSNEEVKIAVTGIGHKIKKSIAKALEFAGLSQSRSNSSSSINKLQQRKTSSDNSSVTLINNDSYTPNKKRESTGSNFSGDEINHRRNKSSDITAESKTTVEGDLFLNSETAKNSLSNIIVDDFKRASVSSSSNNSDSINELIESNRSNTVSLPVNASFASLDSVYLDSFGSNYQNQASLRGGGTAAVPMKYPLNIANGHHNTNKLRMDKFALNKPAPYKKDEVIAPHVSAKFTMNDDNDDDEDDDDDDGEDYASDEDSEEDGDRFSTIRPYNVVDDVNGDVMTAFSVPSVLANDLELSKTRESGKAANKSGFEPKFEPLLVSNGGKAEIIRRGDVPKYSFFSYSDSDTDSDSDSELSGSEAYCSSEISPVALTSHSTQTPLVDQGDTDEDEDEEEELTIEFKPRRSVGNINFHRSNSLSTRIANPVPGASSNSNSNNSLSSRFNPRDLERVSSPLSKNAPTTEIANINAHLASKAFVNHYNKDHIHGQQEEVPETKEGSTSRHRSRSVTVGILNNQHQPH